MCHVYGSPSLIINIFQLNKKIKNSQTDKESSFWTCVVFFRSTAQQICAPNTIRHHNSQTKRAKNGSGNVTERACSASSVEFSFKAPRRRATTQAFSLFFPNYPQASATAPPRVGRWSKGQEGNDGSPVSATPSSPFAQTRGRWKPQIRYLHSHGRRNLLSLLKLNQIK